ncbi:hypothetical protein D9611_000518 [Ephemerocybe angulata]|uniref:WD40 repeat-like protein n=1 Tax=Ephemerocybe angulata TaxID=980116 RepID=A0A8H5BNB8_9AGAR|nr:hypothetical protein D9611_000518 [Tulosesus angulatus]
MTAQSSNPVILPVITVQPTVGEVIEEVNSGIIPSDTFWTSCYKTGEPSVHARINVELDERDRNLVRLKSDTEGVDFQARKEPGASRIYRVYVPSFHISDARVFQPIQEYEDSKTLNPPNPKRVEAFDVSPDGSRFATGFLDGSVLVYPTSPVRESDSFSPRRVTSTGSKLFSRPHASSVTTLQFFPSSKVLLTGGLDFSLSILPADLPDTPNVTTEKTVEAVRTLRGHKRAITSTAIIGVGRNVLSSSLDSTIKLWDVPSGTEITSLGASSGILATSTGLKASSGGDVLPSDEREVPEVQSNAVFAGLRDGTFEVFDLATKKSTFRSHPPARAQQLTAIAYSSQRHTLATGSNTGLITIYDVRNLETPLTSFVRQGGEILDLAAFTAGASDSLGLAVATSDGLPFVARIGADGTIQVDELIGVDCDPVRHVRVLGEVEQGGIWLSSDDSIIRRYAYQW